METGTENLFNIIGLTAAILYGLWTFEKNRQRSFAAIALGVVPFILPELDQYAWLHVTFVWIGTIIWAVLAKLVVWYGAPLLQKKLRLDLRFMWGFRAAGAIIIFVIVHQSLL